MTEKRIESALFTVKEDDRRQTWLASINTRSAQWQNIPGT